MVLGVLDPAEHEVTFVNAGHMSPLLRGNGATREVVAAARAACPWASTPTRSIPRRPSRWRRARALTVYSDGITEAMNDAGELYGRERLLAQIDAADGGDVAGLGDGFSTTSSGSSATGRRATTCA